jgi:hypothetical protein
LTIEVLDPASVETASSVSPMFATVSMYLILGVALGDKSSCPEKGGGNSCAAH